MANLANVHQYGRKST